MLPLLFAAGLTLALAATRELGYSRSVTPGLVRHYSSQFGQGSIGRIDKWQTFLRAFHGAPHDGTALKQVGMSGTYPSARGQHSGSDLQLLDSVNGFFNDLPYIADLTQWGVDDYWATPAEMLASNGGDCEDYAIAKYFALKELGLPIERLRITYVTATRLNQAHMVLAYYAEPTAVPLILDNLDDRVRPASERADLIPVYSFNDDEVVLARQNLRLKTSGSASPVRMWGVLMNSLERELQY